MLVIIFKAIYNLAPAYLCYKIHLKSMHIHNTCASNNTKYTNQSQGTSLRCAFSNNVQLKSGMIFQTMLEISTVYAVLNKVE